MPLVPQSMTKKMLPETGNVSLRVRAILLVQFFQVYLHNYTLHTCTHLACANQQNYNHYASWRAVVSSVFTYSRQQLPLVFGDYQKKINSLVEEVGVGVEHRTSLFTVAEINESLQLVYVLTVMMTINNPT